MKTLVIGCNGQLGKDMVITAQAAGHHIACCDYPNIDISNQASVFNVITDAHPDVIINCAAFTAVDACETEIDKAFSINATGVRYIATAAKKIDAKLVHISTDYVFDGTKKTPYVESDATNPQSVYGKSKLLGEQELISNHDKFFIFRIAWLYGTRGNNFLKTIRSLGEKRIATKEPLKVVNDQFGTPTYSMHVCKQILAVMETEQFGLYHATSEGSCSWFDFAKAIIDKYNIPVDVLPCTTLEFPRPAPRPAYSVLENSALKTIGLNTMPNWEIGLEEYYKEEKSLKEFTL